MCPDRVPSVTAAEPVGQNRPRNFFFIEHSHAASEKGLFVRTVCIYLNLRYCLAGLLSSVVNRKGALIVDYWTWK